MFCTSFLLKQPLEHLNHLLSYQLSHTRKTITIPLIIWTSDTFRRKFLFFFLDGLQHVPLAHLLLCPQKNLQCIQSFNSLSSFSSGDTNLRFLCLSLFQLFPPELSSLPRSDCSLICSIVLSDSPAVLANEYNTIRTIIINAMLNPITTLSSFKLVAI